MNITGFEQKITDMIKRIAIDFPISELREQPWGIRTPHPETESGTSQASKILAYMKAGNRITGLQALDLFGCFRLPARIADIKRAGHAVIKDTIVVNGKRVAQYRMEA